MMKKNSNESFLLIRLVQKIYFTKFYRNLHVFSTKLTIGDADRGHELFMHYFKNVWVF